MLLNTFLVFSSIILGISYIPTDYSIWCSQKIIRILDQPLEFDVNIQVQTPPALVAVYNFIWVYDPDEIINFKDILNDVPDVDVFGDLAEGLTGQAECIQAEAAQDGIAEAMWQDYQCYINTL